jgi:hypothetical protein
MLVSNLMRDKVAALTARTCVAVAYMLLVAHAANGFSGSGNSTEVSRKAWTAYTQAQRQFQQELADFFVSRRPDLKDLVLVSRDLQLSLIERRSLEFRYLIATHPERIVRDQGISRFSNYDWTDEDAKVLGRSNPDYEAARRHVGALRERSDGHPEWPVFRAANQVLAKDADYQKIFERFEQRVKAAGKLLEGSQ